MENKQNKLAKNAAIYSFFTLLQRGLGFFLLPVYTTVLATEELGIISTSTAVIAFMVLVFGLALRGSTAFYYYEYKDNNLPYLKRIFGTNVSFILLVSGLGIALLLISKMWTLDQIFLNIDFNPYVLLSLICIFLQPLYFFYQSVLKAKQQAKKAASLDFVYFGVMISLTLLFILGFGMKAEGALLANAIASFSAFTISIFGLRKEVSLCLSGQILKKTLKYSLPVLPHNLSGWAMNLVDRVMLNSMGSLSLVGIFDVGSQLGKVVNMISLGVNSAYSPWFFDQVKNDPNCKEKIARITKKILIFYVFIAIAISWLSPELLQLISKPDYHNSWKIVPIIATAFVINGFYFTFSNVFFLEKTKYLPFLSITGAIVNVGLNLYLIPRHGIFGAAVASLLTKIIFTVITYLVSQRLFKIPYNLFQIIGIMAIGFGLACLPYIFQEKISNINIWLLVLVKILILSTFTIGFVYKNLSEFRKIIQRKNGR